MAAVVTWNTLKTDVMIPTLSSLVAPQVVMLTTCDATIDNKIGIITTLSFQYKQRAASWEHSVCFFIQPILFLFYIKGNL